MPEPFVSDNYVCKESVDYELKAKSLQEEVVSLRKKLREQKRFHFLIINPFSFYLLFPYFCHDLFNYFYLLELIYFLLTYVM